MNGRIAAPLVVLSGAAVAAVAVLAFVGPAPTPVPGAPTTSRVTAAQAVCPPLLRPGQRSGYVALADLPDPSGATGAVRLSAAGRTLATVPTGSSLLSTDRMTTLVPLVGTASGSAAPGLAMTRSEVFTAGSERGYLLQQCSAPSPERWFVGGSTTQGSTTVLELVNPDPTSAQVDVDVYGPSGPIDAPGGHGILIPGYAVRTLSLTALAPDVPLLAFRVSTSTGRVSASAFLYGQRGLTSLGMTALPPSGASLSSLLLGIPLGGKRLHLQVFVPGAEGATVSVRLLTADGGFVPVGGDSVTAAAGSVSNIDLTQGLAGQSASLQVTSSVPVAVSARIDSVVPGSPKTLTILGPSQPLTSVALVPGLRSGTLTRLYLAGGARGGAVSVAVWPGGAPGPLPAQLVQVPADRQVVWGPPQVSAWWYTLVVTPVSGAPLGAGLLAWSTPATGAMIAAVPLVPLVQQIELPAARFDIGVSQP